MSFSYCDEFVFPALLLYGAFAASYTVAISSSMSKLWLIT